MTFTVTIQPANISFSVAAHSNLLQAGLDANMDFSYGCQAGACGTCMVKKLHGEVTYEDNLPPALSEEDHLEGFIVCCQATAVSDLVLEIDTIAGHQKKILTLPLRVRKISPLNDNELAITLKLPGRQNLPDFHPDHRFEILAGAGKTLVSNRLPCEKAGLIKLSIERIASDKYIDFLFNELQEDEILRIRGPV